VKYSVFLGYGVHLIALAETLINDDSAATRLMARNLLRKYS